MELHRHPGPPRTGGPCCRPQAMQLGGGGRPSEPAEGLGPAATAEPGSGRPTPRPPHACAYSERCWGSCLKRTSPLNQGVQKPREAPRVRCRRGPCSPAPRLTAPRPPQPRPQGTRGSPALRLSGPASPRHVRLRASCPAAAPATAVLRARISPPTRGEPQPWEVTAWGVPSPCTQAPRPGALGPVTQSQNPTPRVCLLGPPWREPPPPESAA